MGRRTQIPRPVLEGQPAWLPSSGIRACRLPTRPTCSASALARPALVLKNLAIPGSATVSLSKIADMVVEMCHWFR